MRGRYRGEGVMGERWGEVEIAESGRKATKVERGEVSSLASGLRPAAGRPAPGRPSAALGTCWVEVAGAHLLTAGKVCALIANAGSNA